MEHSKKMCGCGSSKHVLKYRYTLDQLREIPDAVEKRIPRMKQWTGLVSGIKDRKTKPCELENSVIIWI